MIETIDTPEELEGSKYDREWFDAQFDECFVDLKQKVEQPETIISVGEQEYKGKTYPIAVMTAGEYSCLSAPSKSKKSFLKSAFVASYIGGDTNKYFSNLKGHRKDDDIIIDVDTEQSKFYAYRTFSRVERMTGKPYDNYFPFKMRHLNPEERVAFIDNLLEDPKFRKRVKIMFIDGIADLIDDSNDLISSNYIVGKILKWTDIYNIHVCVVIHNKFGEKKPTGHLGSATLKKAESVIFLENLYSKHNGEDKKTGVVKCTQDYSRGKEFEEFFFTINDSDVLPYECDEYGNIKDENYVPPPIPEVNPNDAFEDREDDNPIPF